MIGGQVLDMGQSRPWCAMSPAKPHGEDCASGARQADDPRRSGTDNRLFVNRCLQGPAVRRALARRAGRQATRKTAHRRVSRGCHAGVRARAFGTLAGDRPSDATVRLDARSASDASSIPPSLRTPESPSPSLWMHARWRRGAARLLPGRGTGRSAHRRGPVTGSADCRKAAWARASRISRSSAKAVLTR